ncbi:bifunctional DNA primase/polymerase [Bradyrhizobium sp. 44]|uniref:bifunctional DNA primase/polymerase n=1 Tax=Bradyrhizobium sp. 44 TaxID=2782675 RepID=UPI001FF8591F|nr:bifunctional DNA primase/polymerase [Bradyrhizobium sp. 44]MCK1286578.1 bifunctional DNA primase/polymerase [Bradyrhizobium sp. 44]
MIDLAQPIALRNAPSSLDYARWLASLGVNVFPLNPATKRPFANADVAAVLGRPAPVQGEGGLKLATSDAAVIGAWWTAWPSALLGIRTGSVSGLYVLDVDRKNDKDGFATIHANNWIIPNTVATQTPSGGGHYYFSIPRGDPPVWSVLRPGDV